MNFVKLHNLGTINWAHPNQFGLTWNLKLTIFQTKFISDQENRKKFIKQEHSAFIVVYLIIFILCYIEPGQLVPLILLNFWNDIIQVSQHLSMLYVSQMFLKIAWIPNNYKFYLPNFLKFCDKISPKLLRPTQCLEKFLEILECFTLKK